MSEQNKTPAPDAVTLPEGVEAAIRRCVDWHWEAGRKYLFEEPRRDAEAKTRALESLAHLRAAIVAALEKERRAGFSDAHDICDQRWSDARDRERDRATTAEARVRELEAALNGALAEMEAGDAPDMRWLPAGGSDLFSMVSNRYRSVYAILDAARQAGKVKND